MSETKDFINGGGSLAPQVDANTAAIAAKYNDNFFINGECLISQLGANQQTGVTHGTHPYDCWRVGLGGITSINADRISGDYPTTAQVFNSSFKATFPTAHTITAGSFCYLEQNLEGIDAKNLIDKEFTVSFWVKASAAGNYSVTLQRFDSGYSYVKPITIITANTWEFKTFTLVEGLPSSLFTDKSSNGLLRIRFLPVVGTTYQTNTTSSWISGNFLGVTGHTNAAATANNTFHLTGVKIELGNEPTTFVSDYQKELTRCRRRFQSHYIHTPTKVSSTSAGTFFGYSAILPVTMRVAPSVAYSADGQVNKFFVETLGYITPPSGGPTGDFNRVGVNAFTTATGAGNWYYVTVDLSAQLV